MTDCLNHVPLTSPGYYLPGEPCTKEAWHNSPHSWQRWHATAGDPAWCVCGWSKASHEEES